MGGYSLSTKSGGPGTACCQLCVPLTHSMSLKAPVDSCRTHSLHITSIHSHAYPKHLDDLRQMALGPMSLSSLSPFPTQDKLKNLDVGYLKSLRWSVFPSCVWDRKTSFYPKEDRKDHRGGTQMIQVLVIFSVSPKSMALYLTLGRGHMCPSQNPKGFWWSC